VGRKIVLSADDIVFLSDLYQFIGAAIFDPALVKIVFSGRQKGQPLPWQRITIRPVWLRDRQHWQFSYFDGRQDFTKNYIETEIPARLDEIFALPFRNWMIRGVGEIIEARLSKRGQLLVSRRAEPTVIPNLAHDRAKKAILTEGVDIPYLRAIGIQTADGRVKVAMRDKFTQINAFLRLLADVTPEALGQGPIRAVDFGCGRAYLTFAAYHYWTELCDIETHLTGVDRRTDLVEQNSRIAAALGWEQLSFVQSSIQEYKSPSPPDIVIALHACDTATDDALAQGIRSGSRLILAAPCCHHDLQTRLAKLPPPGPFAAIWRDGLFFERFADVLTDTFRTLILRLLGYHVDVIEFVAPEHTLKNVLLRAVKTAEPGQPKAVRDYLELQGFWSVEPYLAQLLRDELAAIINNQP